MQTYAFMDQVPIAGTLCQWGRYLITLMLQLQVMIECPIYGRSAGNLTRGKLCFPPHAPIYTCMLSRDSCVTVSALCALACR